MEVTKASKWTQPTYLSRTRYNIGLSPNWPWLKMFEISEILVAAFGHDCNIIISWPRPWQWPPGHTDSCDNEQGFSIEMSRQFRTLAIFCIGLVFAATKTCGLIWEGCQKILVHSILVFCQTGGCQRGLGKPPIKRCHFYLGNAQIEVAPYYGGLPLLHRRSFS